LPLTLVFAGLGDTKERINEIGITNGAYAFDVGALAAHEQAQVIEGFCAHFGLTVGHQRNRLYAFFEPTEGWPRHLYWAQRALAEIVPDPAINGHLDNIPDWTILEHRRDQFRRATLWIAPPPIWNGRTSLSGQSCCVSIGMKTRTDILRYRPLPTW